MEEALCDVMVFLRRGGREKRDGRKPVRGGTDLSERARGEGTRRSGVSLCTGLSIFLLFLFLVLGFCLLGTIIANVLRCFTGYLV